MRSDSSRIESGREPFRHLDNCSFSLPADHRVNERLLQRLARHQAGVPASENYGLIRKLFFRGFGDADRSGNHRAGEHGDAKAQSVSHLFEHTLMPIRRDCRIYYANFEAGLEKR